MSVSMIALSSRRMLMAAGILICSTSRIGSRVYNIGECESRLPGCYFTLVLLPAAGTLSTTFKKTVLAGTVPNYSRSDLLYLAVLLFAGVRSGHSQWGVVFGFICLFVCKITGKRLCHKTSRNDQKWLRDPTIKFWTKGNIAEPKNASKDWQRHPANVYKVPRCRN